MWTALNNLTEWEEAHPKNYFAIANEVIIHDPPFEPARWAERLDEPEEE